MSIHASLGKGSSMTSHRSVIKRHEKMQSLREKGQWDETKSVLGLPKVKMQKIKAKKEKAAAKAGDAVGAPAGAKPAAGAAAPAAKAAAGAKPAAAAKPAEKKK